MRRSLQETSPLKSAMRGGGPPEYKVKFFHPLKYSVLNMSSFYFIFANKYVYEYILNGPQFFFF